MKGKALPRWQVGWIAGALWLEAIGTAGAGIAWFTVVLVLCALGETWCWWIYPQMRRDYPENFQ